MLSVCFAKYSHFFKFAGRCFVCCTLFMMYKRSKNQMYGTLSMANNQFRKEKQTSFSLSQENIISVQQIRKHVGIAQKLLRKKKNGTQLFSEPLAFKKEFYVPLNTVWQSKTEFKLFLKSLKALKRTPITFNIQKYTICLFYAQQRSDWPLKFDMFGVICFEISGMQFYLQIESFHIFHIYFKHFYECSEIANRGEKNKKKLTATLNFFQHINYKCTSWY